MVKNLPANAWDTGLIPGPGRSHMPQNNQARAPQLLHLCVTTTEAHMPRAHAPQQREATTMRSPHTAMKSSPRSPQLEKACAQQQRPNTAKNK